MQVYCCHTLMTQAFTIDGWRDLRSVSKNLIKLRLTHSPCKACRQPPRQ